jgi:Glyoxalase-like domain
VTGAGVRLRQAVVSVGDLDATVKELREAFGLLEPFEDPGVGAFGLRNAVFAVGDTFLEAVSPKQPGTTAERYMDRHGGDCGYMVIFQFDDLDAARKRAGALGVRVVWQADMDDISGTHLHPADMRGAIVSLDRADPPGSWRWGGPDWIGKAGTGVPGRVTGITVSLPDPDHAAERWAEVLGVELGDSRLELDDSFVEFRPSTGDDGITEVHLELPDDVRAGRDSVLLAGVTFRLRPYS